MTSPVLILIARDDPRDLVLDPNAGGDERPETTRLFERLTETAGTTQPRTIACAMQSVGSDQAARLELALKFGLDASTDVECQLTSDRR